jgi:hypothetical protein
MMQSQTADIRLENTDETSVVLSTVVQAQTISGSVGIAGRSSKPAGFGQLSVEFVPLRRYHSAAPRIAAVDSVKVSGSRASPA